MLGFETVQMLLHGGAVNAQELVGGGHYVGAIRFVLGAFLVHELVARECWRITLITRNSVLRRAEEPRLEMLRLRTSIWPDWYGGASMPAKATSAFLGVKTAHIIDLHHKLGAKGRSNAEHPHHNGVFWQRRRQWLHFISEWGQGGGSGPGLGHCLSRQKLSSISFRNDAEMPAGGGVDVQRFILAEVVAVLLCTTSDTWPQMPFWTAHRRTHNARRRQQSPPTSRCRLP